MQQELPVRKQDRLLLIILRVCIIAVCISMFIPAINPARLTILVNRNASLFTNAMSYSSIMSDSLTIRAVQEGWVERSSLVLNYIGALICGLALIVFGASFCLTLGNTKMKSLGVKFSFTASLAGLAGTFVLRLTYDMLLAAPRADRIEPALPFGVAVFFVLFGFALFSSIAVWITCPKPKAGEKYEIAAKYRLILMILPILVLVILFSYLPLWGWRYAFFDYSPGFSLTMNDFVGLKWLRYIFENTATRAHIGRVLRNTMAMSGIGLATAWLPMLFAIFLSELRTRKFKSTVQTLTTIPNFISWVLVYSVAFAIFSTEGFFNWMLMRLGVIDNPSNWLMSGSNIWLKMWLWGTWKGLGWGAIIYIASISSIDPQLYEAAEVDGAGRFTKMWYVTIPGLLPTFFVLLLLGIANILSNGMDQYLVFYNPSNRETIEVLDLYVYHLGLTQGNNIPLATLIGMLKSIISITLLFGANRLSKILRGETIV